MTTLYTGDYSRLPDRHLSGADTPPTPHVVIVESTYGTSRHLPALEREKRFIDKVHETVVRGGRVLMPIVALGRAQVRGLGPGRPERARLALALHSTSKCMASLLPGVR
jgi:predicted metal-dependent RNase